MNASVLLLSALLAFAESAVGLGLVLPGETAIVTLAAANTAGVVPLLLSVALGATAGDHVGYALGRHWGSRLASTRLVARIGVDRWERATDLLRRHGMAALLTSRLLPVVRTLMPAAAGASGLRYWRFLPASVLGSLVWASVWVGAGSSIGALSTVVSLPVLVALAAGAAAAALAVMFRRRAVARAAAPAGSHRNAPEPGDGAVVLDPDRVVVWPAPTSSWGAASANPVPPQTYAVQPGTSGGSTTAA